MAQETLFAVMIFVVVLLMSQAFVAPVMGARRAARHRLRERINVLGGTTAGQAHASLVRQKYLQRLTPLQRRLESLPHMDRLSSMLSQAGLDYPAHKVILLSLGLATLAGLLTLIKTESYVLSLLAVPFGASLPLLYIQRRRGNRLRKFEEQLPDALSVVSRSLKAGLPFSESIKMVASEMDQPVSEEFGRVFAELNYGGDVRSALFGMLERVPSIAVMAVVTAVLIERETGGNMADVLERIANLIRQRFRFQRSVRTLTSEGRGTAWVVAVAPFALAAALEAMKPGWITDLVADPLGQKLFIGAFCLMVVGILWLRRLVNIDV